MKYTILILSIWIVAHQPAQAQALAQGPVKLTVSDCINRVLAHNPRLQAMRHRKQAMSDVMDDTRQLANPELEVEWENFGGTGVLKDVEMGEHTFRISQPIEIGGKRRVRRESAGLQFRVAELQFLQERAALVRDTRLAFIATLHARDTRALAADSLDRTREMLGLVESLLQEGLVPESDKRKARLQVLNAQLRLETAGQAYDAALARLTSLWGNTGETTIALQGELSLPAAPSDDIPDNGMSETVSGLLLQTQVAVAEKEVELARKLRLPNLSIQAGYRTFHDTDEHAYVAGISLELPVFNTGRWKAGMARARALETGARIEAERLQLETDLQNTCRAIARAYRSCVLLEQEMLPVATAELAAARTAYREGQYSYLEVLESLRVWLDVREKLSATLTAYAGLAAEQDYLLTRP